KTRGARNKTAATTQEAANGSGPNGRQRAQYHADAVPVHVDFAIGTNSVLTPGALHAGEQVVVDGQEKLVDGGNVSPQQAHTRPAANNQTLGSPNTNSAAKQANPRGGRQPVGQMGQNMGQGTDQHQHANGSTPTTNGSTPSTNGGSRP
ncbi:MAG TPA: hypothetical protein VLI45_05845, partial [Acidobacteriaceae bacterium]|nr:hypothetical protein [Acidobacteriaceae bacterium]